MDDVDDDYGRKTMERQKYEVDEKSKKLETRIRINL